MKTTIDIPEDEFKDAIKYAGSKTKRDAIVTAVADYNGRQRMAELVKYSGVSDTLMSNREIEASDERCRKSGKERPQSRRRRP